jgi:hypothetical protein
MSVNDRSSPPPPHGRAHRVLGVAVALGAVFLLLTGVISYAMHELRQNIDEVYGSELDTLAGTVRSPLDPGVAAEYDDGVRVTVTSPRRVSPAGAADRTYAVSATWVNNGDGPLPFRARTRDPVAVWAGTPAAEGDLAARTTVVYDDHGPAVRRLPPSLRPGERVTVDLRFSVPDDIDRLTLRYAPSDLRDSAYWQLDLDAAPLG